MIGACFDRLPPPLMQMDSVQQAGYFRGRVSMCGREAGRAGLVGEGEVKLGSAPGDRLP